MKKLTMICAMLVVIPTIALTGCFGGSDTQTPDTTTPGTENSTTATGTVGKIHEAVKTAYGESYYPQMALSKTELSTRFGIDEKDIKEFIAEIPMISTNIDTFVSIEAVDESAASRIKTNLEDYKKTLVPPSVYPADMAKAQASEIVVNGNVVSFLLLGETSLDLDPESSEGIAYAKEQVKIGLDAIEKALA